MKIEKSILYKCTNNRHESENLNIETEIKYQENKPLIDDLLFSMNNIHIHVQQGVMVMILLIYVFLLLDLDLREKVLHLLLTESMNCSNLGSALLHREIIFDFLIKDQVSFVLYQLVAVLYVLNPFLEHIIRFLCLFYILEIHLQDVHIEYLNNDNQYLHLFLHYHHFVYLSGP